MERLAPTADYFIWGIDDSPYGPVQLSVLLDWINDERVLPETWVFTRRAGAWQKASDLPELAHCFKTGNEDLSTVLSPLNFKPGTLRRINILADLKDAQLAQLVEYLEYQECPRRTVVVKQGEPGDAMYLVLNGEFRARTMATGRETILATYSLGNFFGETALLEPGPRSADVVANVDSAVLRLSTPSFERLTREAPNLATPFLRAVSRSLPTRGRNRRAARRPQVVLAGGKV